MAKTNQIGLASALALALSMAIASPCMAQQYTSDTWDGLETVTISEFTYDGDLISNTTDTFNTALTIQFYPQPPSSDFFGISMFMADVDISAASLVSTYGVGGESGYVYEDMYPGGYQFAYFDAIPGVYADATYTGSFQDLATYNYDIVNAYFQTDLTASAVPEPSAITLAVLAIGSVSVVTLARKLAGRPRSACCATSAVLVRGVCQ